MSQARKRARRLVCQALYQWQITSQDIDLIETQFKQENSMKKVDEAYFKELLHEVPRQVEVLDDHILPYISRPIDAIDPVERGILRLGAYELLNRLDIPYRVVINEAVELAKTFGAEQAHKFINGVLDKLAAKLRASEINSQTTT